MREVKANLFRVLGHPARVRILELLREGERSVGALQVELGLDSGGTSQHLAALRRIGLVESRREGTSVYYRVDDERVFDLLDGGPRDHHAATGRAAVDPARAGDDMIGAVLVAGLGAIALGGILAATRATFLTGLGLQAAGAVAVAVAGFSVLATGDELGAVFTSAFEPRIGVDGLSGLFLGTLGLVAAPALVFSIRYLEPTLGGRVVGALTAPFLLALAAVLCARDPLTFLVGWELMTLLPAAIILVAREGDRPARETVFVLRRDHAPRQRRYLDRDPAARRGGGDRRCVRARRRAPGSRLSIALAAIVGIRDEGGRDAAPRLAPARPSDRARARVGADERRDDQGRDLRARARARRVGRGPAGLGRRARARAGRCCPPSAASSTRCSSTSSSGCSHSTRSRTSASSCSGSERA